MFTLDWTQTAYDSLWAMTIRANALDRPRIAAAVDEIDRALRIDPENEGESGEEGRRIFLCAARRCQVSR